MVNSKAEVLDLQENKFIFSCFLCRKKFTHNKDYFVHISNNHKTFRCDDCKSVFGNKQCLITHFTKGHKSKSHNPKLFKCDTCELKFKTRKCLKLHKKLIQSQLRNPCYVCNKKFTSYEELKKHNENKHTYPRHSYQCHHCLQSYKWRESMKNHIKRCHTKITSTSGCQILKVG